MKKILSVLMIVLVLCLVGCSDNNSEVTRKTDNKAISVWTDTETGVQYIIYCYAGGYSGMGGITPRLNADGTLYIEGEQQ